MNLHSCYGTIVTPTVQRPAPPCVQRLSVRCWMDGGARLRISNTEWPESWMNVTILPAMGVGMKMTGVKASYCTQGYLRKRWQHNWLHTSLLWHTASSSLGASACASARIFLSSLLLFICIFFSVSFFAISLRILSCSASSGFLWSSCDAAGGELA